VRRQLVATGAGTRVDLQVADERAERREPAHELDRAAVVRREVVAVGDVEHIDVPVLRREAILLDLEHRLEGGGDPGATRLHTVEELVLRDLARLRRVGDEDELGLVVAAAQELHAPVEEQPRDALAAGVHGPRHVHGEEDHRLVVRLRQLP
jgi:hypothetical protein